MKIVIFFGGFSYNTQVFFLSSEVLDSLGATLTAILGLWHWELGPTFVAELCHAHAVDIEVASLVTQVEAVQAGLAVHSEPRLAVDGVCSVEEVGLVGGEALPVFTGLVVPLLRLIFVV